MGTIYKKNGSWYINYMYQGRRIRKKISTSKKIAELALKDIELKIARDELKLAEKNVKLEKVFNEFSEYLKSHKAPKTAERYIEILVFFKAFIEDNYSNVYLNQIKEKHIEEYKRGRLEKIKPVTVNFDLRVLNIFFNYAIKQNYAVYNPVPKIERLKVAKKEIRFFSKEEINKILENCNSFLKNILLVLLNSGMRRGELINLEWSDIDFERRVIKINVKEFWVPKNRISREIPMNDIVYEVLQKQKEIGKRDRWVFTYENGKQLDQHIRDRLQRICKSLNIHNINIHTCRHTFASHLVMSGVDIPSVQCLLGHQDIETTMKYAHLSPDHLKSAINKLKL